MHFIMLILRHHSSFILDSIQDFLAGWNLAKYIKDKYIVNQNLGSGPWRPKDNAKLGPVPLALISIRPCFSEQ
jgi:hypothetical protein